MRKHRISDDDAQALVTGEAPAERPELTSLARSISEFRVAAFATPPRPSAELRTRLDLAPASRISAGAATQVGAETSDAGKPETSRPRASVGGMKRMFAWFTGLGVAAKVVLGVTAAAAVGATGVGAAAGITTLVTTTTEQQQVTPTDDPTDVSVDPTQTPTDTFGDSVSDRAHELGKDSDGAAFGEEISEEAQQLGDEKAQNPDDAGTEGSGAENADDGQEHAPELPDAVPGGDD